MNEEKVAQTVKQYRVLIADDEPWFVQPLRDALEFEGYKVENVGVGSAALAIVRSDDTRPAVLILDIMMDPGGLQGQHDEGARTGLVVLEELRKESNLATKNLPVICLTIVDDENLRKRIEQLGADFYSKRNYKVAEIVSRIRRLTNKN